ncbi:heat-inducible transcription repressor HrcA [bacterium]|nr:heat-inducible transcription repressor HrcA [bacterium]
MNQNKKDREKLILKYVVRFFIDTGNPVGSGFISKQLPVDISAATIRNIMSELEEQGYLQHPHTSAGRVPTDKGYRAYVNDMVDLEELSVQEKTILSTAIREITHKISQIAKGVDDVLFFSSKALADISNELGIILSPRFNLCIFEKLNLIPIASDRILIELSLRSGFVKNVILEVESNLAHGELPQIEQALNERLSGLTVAEIRKTIADRLRDLSYTGTQRRHFYRVFLSSSDHLFNFDDKNLLTFAGANNILSKPDFSESNDPFAIIRMLEEKSRFVDLLSEQIEGGGVAVTIGGENDIKDMSGCSIVKANYRLGDVTGTVGVIGPKRMPYGKIIPLVRHTANLLDEALNND